MHDRRPAIQWRGAKSGWGGYPQAGDSCRADPQALPWGAPSRPGTHRVEAFQPAGSLTYQVSADRDRFAIVVTIVERSGHTVNSEFEHFTFLGGGPLCGGGRCWSLRWDL